MRTRLLLTLAVLAVLGLSTHVLAASSATDPTGDTAPTGGKLDLIEVATTGTTPCPPPGTGDCITFSFDTAADFDVAADFFLVRWDLDLNDNGTLGESQDACIFLEAVAGDTGTVLRATLKVKEGCVDSAATGDAVKTGTHVEFSLRLQDIRDAGLGTGSAYGYFLTASDSAGRDDQAPDQPATSLAFVDADLTQQQPTPTLTATATATASATPTGETSPTPTATMTASPTSTFTSGTGGTDSTSTPTTQVASGLLPRTGTSILMYLVIAGALVYAGIELIAAKGRLEEANGDR